MNDILITGSCGFLGEWLMKHGNVVGTLNKTKPSIDGIYNKIDLTNKNDVIKLLNRLKPKRIINTAAFTNVDLCEIKRDLAYQTNVIIVENLVEYCKNNDCKLTQISTDYVFDGKKGDYKEDDKPNPINYYGETKLEAEKIVGNLTNYQIIRTSMLYDLNKDNFLTWIINNLKDDKSLTILTDQYGSPTLVRELAETLLKIKELNGVYHVVGQERINRFDMSMIISRLWDLNNDLLKPIDINSLCLNADRGSDTSLNSSKLFNDSGLILSDVLTGLYRIK